MIGVVAALREELTALERRLAGSRRRRVGALPARLGELGGRRVCLLATGVGGRRAELGVRALLEEARCDALLGLGVAGGLSEGLRVADLVRAACVVAADGARLEPSGGVWGGPETPASAELGTVVTVGEIVATAEAKRRLAARLAFQGPVVVDLESSVWARAAECRELPWCIVRAVSDLMDETLPVDFERFRTPAGGISRTRLAAHAVVRPRLVLELDRLRRRVGRCAVRLADATEELLAC